MSHYVYKVEFKKLHPSGFGSYPRTATYQDLKSELPSSGFTYCGLNQTLTCCYILSSTQFKSACLTLLPSN